MHCALCFRAVRCCTLLLVLLGHSEMSSPLLLRRPPTRPPLAVPDPVRTRPTRPKAMLRDSDSDSDFTTHSPRSKHVLATDQPSQQHPSRAVAPCRSTLIDPPHHPSSPRRQHQHRHRHVTSPQPWASSPRPTPKSPRALLLLIPRRTPTRRPRNLLRRDPSTPPAPAHPSSPRGSPRWF